MRWKFQNPTNAKEPMIEVELEKSEGDTFFFKVDDKKIALSKVQIFPSSIRTQEGSLSIETWTKQEWRVSDSRASYVLKPQSWEQNRKGGSLQIQSQMPGKILKLLVKENDEVKEGQTLLIMEAMKMENEIRSEISGRIKKIGVQAGNSVEAGAFLLEFASSD